MDDFGKNKAQLLEEAFSEELRTKLEGEIAPKIKARIDQFIEREWEKGIGLDGPKPIIEQRVKSADRFKEKIKRKGYIDTWDVADSQGDNVKVICEQLPDLIGFRLNCMFLAQEEQLYKRLQALNDDRIKLDFSESTTMSNTHRIFKVTGTYTHDDLQKYCFEIQIKSLINNLWGEVDHRALYKEEKYSVNRSLKRKAADEAFAVLEAADRQLRFIYDYETAEDDLIKGLFFLLTHEKVQQASETNILAALYSCFFDLYYTTSREQIREFVGASLLGTTSKKAACDAEDGGLVSTLANEIGPRYNGYCLKVLEAIASQLYAYESQRDFLVHLASIRLMPIMEINDNLEPEFKEDAFEDDEPDAEGETDKDNPAAEALKFIDEILKPYILEKK